MKYLLACLGMLFLCSSGSVYAQRGGNCGRYEDAREQYIVGAFDDAIFMARQCIDNPPELTREAMQYLYPLLVQAYLAQPQRDMARASIRELHTALPDYRPDPIQDPPSYHKLFSEVLADIADPPIPEAPPATDAVLLYFDTRELNIDQEVAVPRIEPQLQRALTLEGFAFTNQPDHADFLVELNAATRAGVERYGRHSAYADLIITVTNPRNGLELYKATVQDVQGRNGSDYTDAGLRALSAVAVGFRQEYLGELVDLLRHEAR